MERSYGWFRLVQGSRFINSKATIMAGHDVSGNKWTGEENLDLRLGYIANLVG